MSREIVLCMWVRCELGQQYSCGLVVLWSCGLVVLWSCGLVVLRTCGLVDLWTCGLVVKSCNVLCRDSGYLTGSTLLEMVFVVCVFLQAELKRLQSANEAARQDRKLLLQQQQDIARLREKTKLFKQRFRRRSKQTSVTPIQSPLRARSPTPQTLLKHSTPLHDYASVVSLTSDSFHGQPATDSRTQNLSSAASITSVSSTKCE